MKISELRKDLDIFEKQNSVSCNLMDYSKYCCVVIEFLKPLEFSEVHDSLKALSTFLDVPVYVLSTSLNLVTVLIDCTINSDEGQALYSKVEEGAFSGKICPLVLEDPVIPRYAGYKTHRFVANPVERQIAEQFNKLFGIFPLGAQSSEEVTRLQFRKSVILGTDLANEAEIAAINATVQWIATPVGQGFLREFLKENPDVLKNIID